MQTFMTIGRVADQLNQPTHRIAYAIATRRIAPADHAAHYRVFDDAGVQQIKKALDEMNEQRRGLSRKAATVANQNEVAELAEMERRFAHKCRDTKS